MRTVPAFALATVLLGCNGSRCTRGQTEAGTKDVPPKASAQAALPVREFSSDVLVVAGPAGLKEVALDGTTARILSATPAQRPRLLSNRRVLFLASEGRELRLLDLGSRNERIVARLPSSFNACPSAAAPHEIMLADLQVNADAHFVVDRSENHVCVRLQNRNDNMMDYARLVRVDLLSGNLSHAALYPPGCETGPPVRECEPRQDERRREPARAHPYRLHESSVIRSEGDRPASVGPRLPPGDWSESLASPSKQWVVLEGAFQEADYIYRSLLLLDRQAGLVYPIREGDTATALTTSELALLDAAPPRTVSAIAETTVRWHPHADVLIVGSLLVAPGKNARDVGGDVAY